MGHFEHAEQIRKPRNLVSAHRMPNQSLVAMKLDYILLSVAEAGHLNCSAKHINTRLPSLRKIDRREKALELLNALVLTFQDDGTKLKVYESVNYSNGIYSWSYTSQYVLYFLNSGIILPP